MGILKKYQKMDWSNCDNDLYKKYSDNLFDNNIDTKIECNNLINNNCNTEEDYEIKQEDFILQNIQKKQKEEIKNEPDFYTKNSLIDSHINLNSPIADGDNKITEINLIEKINSETKENTKKVSFSSNSPIVI